MNALGYGPTAFGRHGRDVVALGEQHERMLQAQLELRHCGTSPKKLASLNRRLSVRWRHRSAADLLQRQGWVRLSAVNAHACRNQRVGW